MIDGFAGLWCVNAGYGQESIVAAAAEQMRALPYATGYFDLGAEAPIRLAAALAERAPGDLNHVYFTLGGSDAVDSTIRFARYYWHSLGQPSRDQFISVAWGYHGSTSMGAGLTALPLFHDGFGLPHDSQHKISSHYLYRNPLGDDPQAVIAASVAELEAKVREIGADRVAAFYLEPIQGSGGVLVPPAGWVRALRETCKALGILFIADEVITAFGRTGPLFACEDEGIVPDMLTVAKGLTSGYVPMGAVFLSEHVYQTIAQGAGAKAVGHGFTYSGHPVSAAVGLEVLRLYEGGLLENGRRAGARLLAGLEGLRDHPQAGETLWRDHAPDPAAVKLLACWQPPADLAAYSGLEVLLSVGAGVDHITNFPKGLRLCRTLAPSIETMVRDWVVVAVLMLHRAMPAYLEQGRAGLWKALTQAPKSAHRVGILGMGRTGRAAALSLAGLGFEVACWSRSGHMAGGAPQGVSLYDGPALRDFLARSEILICLLPLTEATTGLLNAALFSALPRGAMLVHAGRGAQLTMDDLRAALDKGQIQAAICDVTDPEPLPADHWAWRDPRIVITPHIAAVTDAAEGARHAITVLRALTRGTPLPGEIDLARGY